MLEFKCAYNQPKQTIVDNVKDSMHSRGGSFIGDTDKGCFNIGERLGRFSGHYQFDTQDITITITRKPIYISNQHVESEVRAYFDRQWIGYVKAQLVTQVSVIEDEELELAGG